MATTAYTIDATHSTIAFSVRHLMIAKVRGRFTRFTGKIELDEAAPAQSRASVEVEMDSIDTAQAQRDGHLKSPDFFDVASHPKASFTTKAIKQVGSDYDIVGQLTLRGVTKDITLRAEFAGKTKDPQGGERAAFSAKTTLEREAFGLTWNKAIEAGGVAVGSKVEMEIDLEAVRAG